MALDERTLALLVCPVCKGRLVWLAQSKELVCRGDRMAFPVRDEIPILMTSAARTLSTQDLEQMPK
ncbi:Trm112 family protein [Pseudidiomarina terrestris]|uniref:Trm112 family protein n=1 Tax=Pseudidiomarina terrestris TaxID=2820060 RepID=UPI002653E8DC|nr:MULTISPECIES: Trm112 family protein [unclassified Pseudidiomarina]MDN7127122.1 Trm112 family protein [Pseudidiomarina sp. 1APR75-33.1]MDN7135465.1 Trm112 family protein [Pseudidiomarina sp. 1ASP75-5]MDN7138503.1 Trm112 family protein [Pseudidiomarina sp. 1ASP75-14]MEA3586797.1 Trm112 family protein [Pseudidiomarina sp. 1APP75-27a]